MAQHLAATYGDKAFEVAKMASVTGKRWPIVGVRLVSEFPYIEAEVCEQPCGDFPSAWGTIHLWGFFFFFIFFKNYNIVKF